MIDIPAVVGAVMFGISLVMLRRNYVVNKYRRWLIDELFERPDWREASTHFHTVTYNEMYYKFWRPVESFYDERKLLSPETIIRLECGDTSMRP